MIKRFVWLAMCVSLVATPALGTPRVWLSDVTEADGTAVEGNLSISVLANASFSIGVWMTVEVDLKINGFALDLTETVNLLSADSITWMEADNFDRWDGTVDGNLNLTSTSLWENGNAVGVSELGLTDSAMFRGFDANYDGTVGAFLVAVLEVTAGATLGSTDLFLDVGTQVIGYDPDTDGNVYLGSGDAAVDRETGGTSSSVRDGVVTVTPEPATMGLLALGALGLIARRRRR